MTNNVINYYNNYNLLKFQTW